jgi:hypothetical protein
MSSLAIKSEPRAANVHFTDDELVVVLTDGRTLSVPLAWFPCLVNASAHQRSRYELLGDGSGIHWPMMDEDISIAGLLMGNASIELPQRPTRRSSGRSKTRWRHADRMSLANLRYSRPFTLCIEALHTLCCVPGDIRERLKLVDQEFLFLKEGHFPDVDGIRDKYSELKQLLMGIEPKADEGRTAATVSRSKKSELERAAQLIWDIHRDFSHHMNR